MVLNLPTITVITVVFNDVHNIRQTIRSVLDQEYPSLEYIIIDGGSCDGTLVEIEQYRHRIAHLISEKDRGIYDAMNKGIALASGQWVNFMNSGDTFHSSKVLRNIKFSEHTDAAVLFGKTWRRDSKIVTAPRPIEVLKTGGIHACHQSMFFNRHLLGKDLWYCDTLKLSGDSELVTKLYAKNYKMAYVDVIVADYMGGGMASSGEIPLVLLWRERLRRYGYVYQYFGMSGLWHLVRAKITRRRATTELPDESS
jgi:glycosyltransferase involved in cell wall biosynthesis